HPSVPQQAGREPEEGNGQGLIPAPSHFVMKSGPRRRGPDFFCPESPNSFDIELILTPKRQSNIVSIRYDAIAAI
ncbi:MAG: hypothetical protein WCJ64_23215, partial [Rhodospirillaceae bacterium]